ncbi:PilW family protein [Tepidimonas taiwanensis]|uniref:PilW family protein n=1 Tax=Tepidimonas taiwanensis TaxID=307486 RepID=UPI000733FDA2|nr:PilW family protein [Tepidimonas taiwanensis]
MKKQYGISIVELMVALALGLLVTGAAFSVFLTNLATQRHQQGNAALMDSARLAFELMARELREAGANACGTSLIVNVLNNPSSNWWSTWNAGGIVGYGGSTSGPRSFGTQSAQRVSGTEAILIQSATLDTGSTITQHYPTSAQFKVRNTNHGIKDGDILMACDNESGAIFQVTNANNTNVTIVHNTGTGNPGNCSKGLGYANPPDCTTNGTSKTFKNGGYLAKLTSVFWYIGHNPRGGRSLYRHSVSGDPSQPDTDEIVDNIHQLEFRYLPFGGSDYVAAANVSNWSQIRAVRITITIRAEDNRDTQGQPVERRLTHTVFLRNQTES